MMHWPCVCGLATLAGVCLESRDYQYCLAWLDPLSLPVNMGMLNDDDEPRCMFLC